MALSYYDAPGNGVATVAPIRLADQFITMDTDEGDNEDPLSLHKYIYASCNPVNRTDPSGHDSFDLGGMSFDSNTPNLEGGLLAAVGLMADPVSPWSINEIGNIDLNGAGMGDLATAEGDPNGFKVAYNGPQSTVVGDIIVYQIIGSSSYVVGPATRVDRGADYEGHAKPGRPLPPAMGAGLSGSSNTQYIDSPGGPGYWRCTAVAVSRLNGRDKLLSSYFFEFDNSTRRIIDREPNYTKDLKVGMKRWGVDTGVLDGL